MTAAFGHPLIDWSSRVRLTTHGVEIYYTVIDFYMATNWKHHDK